MKNLMTHFVWRCSALSVVTKVTTLTGCLGLVLLPSVGSGTSYIVTPGGYENRQGNSTESAPFREEGPFRLQQVIAASEFERAGGPIEITRLAFRMRSDGVGFAMTMTNQINLSTTAKSPGGLSLNFSENIGPDESVVLPPAVRGFGGAHDPGVPTQPFFTIYRFSQPFQYDPREGNLLLDIRNYGVNNPFPLFFPGFDAVNLPGDGVSSLVGPLPNSSSGGAFDWGYIIEFEYTPIPEPSVFILAFIGMLVWAFVRRASVLQGR